ncbi:MAG: 3-ketoacyl-ACP reductase [Clostridia bacterium]|nr:3-ketoacyl-ACP reductase [Clostridia bacterium]
MFETPVALVTGASRGIGLGIAKELASAGFFVILSATRPAAEDALAAVRSLGPGADYIPANIGEAADREALFAMISERYGRLDLLVNNAGVAPTERRDILTTTEESFDRVLGINLRGTFFMCQLAANLMISCLDKNIAGYTPRIVNISSMSAYTSSTNRGEYCISKAGISMTTALFADRLAEYGICVYEIRPGIIATDMTSGVMEKYDRLIADGVTPIRRWGTPEDIGRAVRAIAEGAFPFSTGEVFNIDGGFHLRRL